MFRENIEVFGLFEFIFVLKFLLDLLNFGKLRCEVILAFRVV